MPDNIVPVTGLDQAGVILDTPPVALPPNAFTNARNVRFKDGAVRKMEGEVNIFEGMEDFFAEGRNIGQVQYLAWWPSPNQTVRDAGYYVFIVENTTGVITHDAYIMLPGATFADTNTWNLLRANFNRQGKWQHTLFNGGFTFIINNGIERPQYITDAEGNVDINQLALTDLPGWDSYNVNELLISDTFTATSTNTFDTGQLRVANQTQYIVERTRGTDTVNLYEGTRPNTDATGISSAFTISQRNNQDVLTFAANILQADDTINIRFQSVNPVNVRAAIVRAFGDFLVAGNMVERDSVVEGNPIIRRLTGVVRSSDVAQPGAIPNNWNPFAAGTSTADEFVIADTGTVQDMVALQGNLYLYTNTSISAMRLTGNAQIPLTVVPVTDQYGALTTDSVLEYDGKHFVIGSDDIYLFGGHPGSIQSISDQKIRRAFFDRVNPINQNLINLFTLRYAARDEIWICFPTIDSVRGEADEAYIWNYRNGTWTIRTLNSVIRGDVAPVPGGGVPSAIITLSGSSGTDDVTRIGSQEVQTFQVESDASVGHADEAQPELQTFATARTVGTTTRPAITTDSLELAEIAIGTDVFAGPNPDTQQVRLTDPAASFTFDSNVLFGGARLTGSYRDQGATEDTPISITAGELFGSSIRVQESGVGDLSPVFDTQVGVTSAVVERSSTSISGNQGSNAASTGITTRTQFNNPVSNALSTGAAGLNDVTVADSTTTFPTRIPATGTAASGAVVAPVFTANTAENSGGSVRATITAGTRQMGGRTTTTAPPSSATGLTVTSGTISQLPGEQFSSDSNDVIFLAGTGSILERAARATSAVDGRFEATTRNINGIGRESNATELARMQNTFFIGTWIPDGSGPPNLVNPGLRTVAENGGAATYVETVTGNNNVITCCDARISGVSNNRDSTYVHAIRWGPGTFFSNNWFLNIQQQSPFTAAATGIMSIDSSGSRNRRRGVMASSGNGTWHVPGYSTTVDTTVNVNTITLASINNTTDNPITVDWAGNDVTVPANTTRTATGLPANGDLGGTIGGVPARLDGTTTTWFATGTAAGRTFTNTESFEIRNFNPAGRGESTLAAAGGAGASRTVPTRLSTWTGNTETITVTNGNSDGAIAFTTNSGDSGSVPGGTSSTFRNHNQEWSFTGEHAILPQHTLITAARLGGEPIDNFTFTATEGGNSATDSARDTAPFTSGEFDVLRLPGDVRNTYAWTFAGDVRSSGDRVANGSTQTSEEFLTRAAEAINNDAVPGLTDWLATPSSLMLESNIPGRRTFNNFEFSTFTARAASLSGADLGPHNANRTVISDNLGIELFTVTRADAGAGAPEDSRYTYTVSTARNTLFPDSDTIRQLEFRSDGNAFNPTDEIFSRDVSPFTFSSDSPMWSLRAGPAATYIPVNRETFTASGTQHNGNGVTVTESTVVGGVAVSGTGISTTTTHGVTVTVQETGTTASPRRRFTVTNPNPYSLAFTAQGVTTQIPANSSPVVINGAENSAADDWVWVSNAVSGSGTGGTTIGDTETTNVGGVTVVSTNTSVAASSTTVSQREQAVLLPASSGNSISNPLTATFNPTREFYFVDFNGVNDANALRAYRVVASNRGAAGARIFSSWGPSRQRFSQNGDWTSGGAESGNITPTPIITASNIDGTVANQRFSGSSQGSTRRSIFGVKGSSGAEAAVSARGAQFGASWTGGINGGSFNSQVLVYTSAGVRPTNLRFILMGASVSVTNAVARVPRESYTVTNANPFPVTFTRSGVDTSVPANGSRTITNVAGEGVRWEISTPSTTSYQYTLTNNNIRPITIASGGTFTAGTLAAGASITSSVGSRNFTSMITREFLASSTSAPSVIMPTVLRTGAGDVGAMQLPVTYNFTNPGIPNFNISIPLVVDASDNMMPTNVQVEERIVMMLRANDTFNDYYTVTDHNDDTAIAAGRFDLQARALPGATFMAQDGTTQLTFPTTPTVFSATVDQQFGGRASLTSNIIAGQDVDDAPIIVTIRTGQTDHNDGVLTPSTTNFADHIVMLSGTYPATAAGDNMINEQFRQVFRNAPFSTQWTLNTMDDTLNPSMLRLTSAAQADYFTTVTSSNSALTPFLRFTTTQDGLSRSGMVYPTVTLTPPMSETGMPITIMLNPEASDTVTDRLSNIEIAGLIRSRFNFPGWTVATNTTPERSGTGVTGNRIKLVKTAAEPVNGAWSFAVTSYGDTGNTLPGAVQPSDGEVLGRLNTDDFTRVTTPDNLDFRGVLELNAQPTRVMVLISNPTVIGGVQYIPFTFGNDSTYMSSDQSGTVGTRVASADMINAIQSGITNVNRRVQTSIIGSTLSIIPSQYSELAQFVLNVIINDDADGVQAWNEIIDNSNFQAQHTNFETLRINTTTSSNGGIQTYGPAIVVDSMDTQSTPSTTRRPDRMDRFAVNTGVTAPQFQAAPLLTTVTSSINVTFDPLRPWPTSQVNLNREFPIFATAILDANTGMLQQNFRGADIGFLFLGTPYESFIERIELAITPEFDTEQLQSLALWGDGGNALTFGMPISQATLDIKMYGTDAPGETRGMFTNLVRGSTTDRQTTVTNDFIIGEDYKIDMRIHGRFLNLLISDFSSDVRTGLRAVIPANMNGVAWNLSGMQADIFKGGRR